MGRLRKQVFIRGMLPSIFLIPVQGVKLGLIA
jgi:hypothetical protein